VDVDALFGGLEVHARWAARDPALRGLLSRAHFVVPLGLGGVQTGARLERRIFGGLAYVAGAAFGSELEAKTRAASTLGEALQVLISAVPRGVPVALLVDEYDAAIIQDVAEGDWAAARAGVKALRSLLMSTKDFSTGHRIERCLVTGVARFAQTSLFSGANNFADLTDTPLLSRVLGFSEAEIRCTFPGELARLGANAGTDAEGAIAELAHWYNGYCFDGASSCFNPYPVLAALEAGKLKEKELAAASGTNWLGLAPGSVVRGLVSELSVGAISDTTAIDIANLEACRVAAVPLLLQTGLLSHVPQPARSPLCDENASEMSAPPPRVVRPPNEYARLSLQRLAETALAVDRSALQSLTAALVKRDRVAFEALVKLIVENLPRTLFKAAGAGGGGAAGADEGDDGGAAAAQAAQERRREAVYHASLFTALKVTAPADVSVGPQAASLRGIADIIVRFSGAPRVTVWAIEVGLGSDPARKLPQAREYARVHAAEGAEAWACALTVPAVPPASKATAAGAPLSAALFAWELVAPL